MRKHKWKLLGAVALVLIVVVVFAARSRPDRVTRENYRRIQRGMSRAEVEAILGPPGDYRTGPSQNMPKYGYYRTGPLVEISDASEFPWGDFPDTEEGIVIWSLDWNPLVRREDHRTIYVTFGPDGASHRSMLPASPREQGGFENLMWRFRRQWRQLFPPADGSGTLDD
jgi:hypothetical protein